MKLSRGTYDDRCYAVGCDMMRCFISASLLACAFWGAVVAAWIYFGGGG